MLLPHSQKVPSHLYQSEISLLYRATLLYKVALYEIEQGNYVIACQSLKGAYAERNSLLGEKHPDTLKCMNGLALVLANQGKYEDADELDRQTLEIRQKVLGKEYPDTLKSMRNLALALDSQGKYEEAEELHRQTLEIRQKLLGKEHPATLQNISNLASVLYSHGKYEEAEVSIDRRWTYGEGASQAASGHTEEHEILGVGA